jgi:hypothetical protein
VLVAWITLSPSQTNTSVVLSLVKSSRVFLTSLVVVLVPRGLLDSYAVSNFGSFPACLFGISDPRELPGASGFGHALLDLGSPKFVPAIQRNRNEIGSQSVEPQVFLRTPRASGLSSPLKGPLQSKSYG